MLFPNVEDVSAGFMLFGLRFWQKISVLSFFSCNQKVKFVPGETERIIKKKIFLVNSKCRFFLNLFANFIS